MTEMIEMTEESTSSFQLEDRDKIPIDFKVPWGYADARHFWSFLFEKQGAMSRAWKALDMCGRACFVEKAIGSVR